MGVAVVRVREIFSDALEIAEPMARRRFLAATCAGDPGLRAEVEELLAWHATGADVLARPALEPPGRGGDGAATEVDATASADDPPPHVPGIVLGAVIGEGGAGRVYEGWQEAPRRRVAVKLLRTPLGGHAAAQRCFREAEILARLDHPGIARVISVQAVRWGGATVPAMVMELVEGGRSIRAWGAGGGPHGGPVPMATRLAAFHEVCEAVGHAHRRGVVHRDLKPGNILVDRAGRPKVVDFDWARCDDAALGVEGLRTGTGQVVGTHQYMSPEQFDSSLQVDARADVWALGMVLFELLAGRPPLDLAGKNVYEAAAIVRDGIVPPLTRFARVPRDLAVIVATCLEARLDRRYADAGALADDLGRHRAGEPILACPAGFVDSVLQVARRHRAAAVASAAVAATVLAATVGIGLFARRAEHARAAAEAARGAEAAALEVAAAARDRAEAEARSARWGQYVANLQQLCHLPDTAEPSAAAALFAATENLARGLGIADTAAAMPLELAILAARRDGATAILPAGSAARAVAVSPDGRLLAAGDRDGAVRVWEEGGDGACRLLAGHEGPIGALVFSADGARLASSSADATARVWDTATGDCVAVLRGHTRSIHDVAFDPAGTRVATASDDRTVRLWDAATGSSTTMLRVGRRTPRVVRFQPGSGAVVAAGTLQGDTFLWETATGREIAALQGRDTRTPAIAFSSDGRLLAAPSPDWGVVVADAASGSVRDHLPGPSRPVLGLDFSPDGSRLAAVTDDATAHLWDPRAARTVATLRGHVSRVDVVRFSPDGRHLATGSWDRTIRLWDAADGAAVATLCGHVGIIEGIAWSPDGARLASCADDSTVRLWDDAAGGGAAVIRPESGRVQAIEFTPESEWLVVGTSGGSVAGYDATAARRIAHYPVAHSRDRVCALSPDGTRIATAQPEGGFLIRALDGGPRTAIPPPGARLRAAAFTGDGARFLVADADGLLRLSDANSGATVAETTASAPGLVLAAPVDGGVAVAVAGRDGDVAIWHPAEERLTRLSGHAGLVCCLVARPGHAQFLTAGADGRVVLRDARSGATVAELPREADRVNAVAFAPDGTRVAVATERGGLRIHALDRPPETVTCAIRGHEIESLAWSPDGTRLATGAQDRTVRVWDAESGAMLLALGGHTDVVVGVAFSPDGRLLASASFDGTVRLWGRSNAEFAAARRQASAPSAE